MSCHRHYESGTGITDHVLDVLGRMRQIHRDQNATSLRDRPQREVQVHRLWRADATEAAGRVIKAVTAATNRSAIRCIACSSTRSGA
jgi:hypothetical protein